MASEAEAARITHMRVTASFNDMCVEVAERWTVRDQSRWSAGDVAEHFAAIGGLNREHRKPRPTHHELGGEAGA